MAGRVPTILVSVLLNVEIDLSVIISAMMRVITKPVIGTAEIATKNTVPEKVASEPNANLKKAQQPTALMRNLATALCFVHSPGPRIIFASGSATTKPVIGTMDRAMDFTIKVKKMLEFKLGPNALKAVQKNG